MTKDALTKGELKFWLTIGLLAIGAASGVAVLRSGQANHAKTLERHQQKIDSNTERSRGSAKDVQYLRDASDRISNKVDRILEEVRKK